MSEPPIIKHLTEESAGKRLDVVLADIFPEYSRSRLKIWIEQGQVLVNGHAAKPKLKMSGDEELQLSVQSIESEENCMAEDIPLNIVYQDDSIIVINKPADFVVHPAAQCRMPCYIMMSRLQRYREPVSYIDWTRIPPA